MSFPATLGRDVSGVVRAVGANVKNFKVGDLVLAFSNATYAGLVAADKSGVTHLPDRLNNARSLGVFDVVATENSPPVDANCGHC